MSPRPRKKENKSLPKRWRFKHNAYYYRVPLGQEHLWDDKKEFRLGKTEPEAYRVWASRIELYSHAQTVGELLERYVIEVIPHKASKSQESNLYSIKVLMPVFGSMAIIAIKPMHVYKFMDLRGKQGKTAANRDLEVLSHAFSKAIEWGLCETHPIKGKVKKFSTPPRTRYIENWEIEEALKVANPFLLAYINLKLMLGLRRGDMLSIKISDLKEVGIHVTPRKTQTTTGKSMIIEWSDELREAVKRIRSLPCKVGSIWLFHTRSGKPYITEDSKANAFDSLWQRFMKKVLIETNVTERFTEHDLRAKVASDTEIEHARQLLGHSSSEITNKVYRRKADVIKPLTRGGK